MIPAARFAFRGELLVNDHNSRYLVATSHTPMRISQSAIRKLRNLVVFTMIDRIIAVSKYVAGCIQDEIGNVTRKIGTIQKGVDIERIRVMDNVDEKTRLRKEFLGEIGDNAQIVLFVGALESANGIEIFLEVADLFLNSGHNIHFIVAGNGSLSSVVQQRCQIGEGQGIYYLGMRDDIDKLLSASDIFVAPYIWGEAFGLTIAEAAACGVPTVASKIGGIAEVVDNGESGILVQPGDLAHLAQAISSLLYNPKDRIHMSLAARQRAVEKFSVNDTARKTIELYMRVCGYMPARSSFAC